MVRKCRRGLLRMQEVVQWFGEMMDGFLQICLKHFSFLGRARRSRDGLMESCTCWTPPPPPPARLRTEPPAGLTPSRADPPHHVTIGALGLYADETYLFQKKLENAQPHQHLRSSNTYHAETILDKSQPQKKHSHKMMHPTNPQL